MIRYAGLSQGTVIMYCAQSLQKNTWATKKLEIQVLCKRNMLVQTKVMKKYDDFQF